MSQLDVSKIWTGKWVETDFFKFLGWALSLGFTLPEFVFMFRQLGCVQKNIYILKFDSSVVPPGGIFDICSFQVPQVIVSFKKYIL